MAKDNLGFKSLCYLLKEIENRFYSYPGANLGGYVLL
jgi:hypothetical protein